jgi:AAA+ ATPase superfamily predicted ATPase
MRNENPYSYNLPVGPEMFFGRQDEVDTLAHHLTDTLGDSFALIGGRRMGKTSFLDMLLRMLKTVMQDSSHIVLPVPLLVDLAGYSVDSLAAFFRTVSEKAQFTLTSLLDLPLRDAVAIGEGTPPAPAFQRTLEQWARATMAQQGRQLRLILLLDECEKIVGQPWAPDLYNSLRYLIVGRETRSLFKVVMAGSHRFLTQVHQRGSPLQNVLKYQGMYVLSAQATRDLVNLPTEGILPETVVQAVARQSGGHPFLAQYLMHHLWEYGLENATTETVQRVAAKFPRERRDFLDWADSLGSFSLRVYGMLARTDKAISEREIRAALSPASPDLPQVLSTLQFYGLVSRDAEGVGYRVAGEMFREWFISEEWLGLVDRITDRLERSGKVARSDFPDVRDSIWAQGVSQYVAETSLDLVYSEDSGVLSFRQPTSLQMIRRLWDKAKAKTSRDMNRFREDVILIREHLGSCLGLPLFDQDRHLINYGRFFSTTVDVSTALQGINIHPKIPMIFLQGDELLESDLDDLRHIMSRTLPRPGHILFLVLFTESEQLANAHILLTQKLRQVYAYDALVLDYRQVINLIGSKDPRRELRRFVLAGVNLESVSPFRTEGPTPDNMFFGRETELREISERVGVTSYAIIGGRRMGKTSLLGRLHRVRLPSAGFYTLYQDCATIPNYEAFLSKVIHDWRPEPPSAAPITFGDLLQSSTLSKPLVLLLDEADKSVPADRANGWPLFSALRSLTNSGLGTIVLSGERTLREARHDPTGPLFNFATEVVLGPLDYEDVEELVTRPMKQLGIELVNQETIVRRVYDFTSGHPNIVQRLCRRLIERLSKQDSRRIALDDVNAIIQDPRFQEVDFLQTYWEDATPLEKIITLVLSQEKKNYRLREVRRLVSKHVHAQPTARATKDALDRLVELRSILKRSQVGYTFAVEAIPKVLENTTTVEDLLEVLAEEYEELEAQ